MAVAVDNVVDRGDVELRGAVIRYRIAEGDSFALHIRITERFTLYSVDGKGRIRPDRDRGVEGHADGDDLPGIIVARRGPSARQRRFGGIGGRVIHIIGCGVDRCIPRLAVAVAKGSVFDITGIEHIGNDASMNFIIIITKFLICRVQFDRL